VSTQTNTHYWLREGCRADRLAALETLGIPPELVPTVDAHRRLRGSYSAAGTLVRALVPILLARNPDLVRRHGVELFSVAPELSRSRPNSRETLTSTAMPKDRSRFSTRLRTQRISDGLVEFVRGSLPDAEPRALVFENVEHAGQTDLEFLAALLRCLEPNRLTVAICTGGAHLPDGELRSVVESRAQVHTVSADNHGHSALAPTARRQSRSERLALAWLYISTDGTSDDPRLRNAYQHLHPADLARLHERRVRELMERADTV
jgi:hypothetical protein